MARNERSHTGSMHPLSENHRRINEQSWPRSFLSQGFGPLPCSWPEVRLGQNRRALEPKGCWRLSRPRRVTRV